ncbi:MAG: 16S rRNA (cytidine(1402)-2'-O)-methyltransferase [Pseudomonadota bacterium]
MTENYQNPTQKLNRMPQNFEENRKNASRQSNDAGQKIEPRNLPMKPGFYLVATPIGNLRDITFRALDVLSSVDLIICEDTRITGKLMSAYGFKKRMQVYNDHSTDEQRDTLLSLVENGQSVAVLSDAGTPLISDPGYKLVRGAIEKELFVTSVPGPNAALTALQLSSLPTDQFSFLGFLPPKKAARQAALKKWESAPSTLICYETGPRLLASLQDMRVTLGNRPAAVTRELTKLYEETMRGTLSDLIIHYTNKGAPKGEIVVVIGRGEKEIVSSESIESQLRQALEKMSVRDAAEMVAQATGKPKKTIYTLALKLSSNSK